MKKPSSLINVVMVITLFTFSTTKGFSVNEFEQYRDKCLEIIKERKPLLTHFIQIFKTITNKEQFLNRKQDIFETLKLLYKTNEKFKQMIRELPDGKKKYNFIMWFYKLDKKHRKLMITMRKEQRRIRRLPGCKAIIKQLKRKIKKYERSLRQ